jgi:hypothetical protein
MSSRVAVVGIGRHLRGDLDATTASMAKAWVQKIYAGANEVMNELIARSL